MNDEIQFANQLTSVVSACLEYDVLQAEILALLQSYPPEVKQIAQPVLLILERIQMEKLREEQERQAKLVKTAINALSYTELEVVVRIFEVLDASEGVLVAGRVADEMGITRSVVVSALRKLESARIVETRSLGVKGTYIKVINSLWFVELSKFRA